MIATIYIFIIMADEINNNPTPTKPAESNPPTANNNQQWQASVSKAKDIAQKLNNSEKAIAGGALVVIIGSFLPAYTYVTDYYTYSQNNLASSIGWLNLVVAAIAFLLILLPKLNIKLPTLPWPLVQVQLILGAIAGVCSLIQMLNYVFDGGSRAGNPALGIFLVLAGSLLMAYTAYNDQKNAPTQTTPPQNSSTTPTTNA